jgi:hypothetical protein
MICSYVAGSYLEPKGGHQQQPNYEESDAGIPTRIAVEVSSRYECCYIVTNTIRYHNAGIEDTQVVRPAFPSKDKIEKDKRDAEENPVYCQEPSQSIQGVYQPESPPHLLKDVRHMAREHPKIEGEDHPPLPNTLDQWLHPFQYIYGFSGTLALAMFLKNLLNRYNQFMHLRTDVPKTALGTLPLVKA